MYISPEQKCEENVESNSLWITATPSAAALSLPFYVCEAGHFYAQKEYSLKREKHNSFLLLYTITGEGTVHTGDTALQLPSGCCVVIDCRSPHEYYCSGDNWDFLWLHFDGCGAAPLLQILYPEATQPIRLLNSKEFEGQLTKLLTLTANNNIISSTEGSAQIHILFHSLLQSALTADQKHRRETCSEDINNAVAYIQEHYASPITIDHMLRDIPMSKYHFIRLFRRIMGVTPYNYLTNYRINRSKIMLRSTENSIAEIAEACGFSDTSNFIAQFKKHTGVRPTHYRRDFSDK